MKKITNLKGIGILAFAAVLMFALFGCGDTDGGGGGNDPVKYTVTLNANGGTVSPTSIQVESGKTVASLPTPAKTTGDTYFWGWYTKNGTTSGDWGVPFTITTPVTASIIVYARWGSTSGPAQYTITFSATGGTVSPASKQVISGSSAGDLPVPTRPNYTFGGWYTEQNGGGTAFTSATIVTGNITVYAKWTIIEQLVELSKNVQLTEANWRTILTEIKTAGKYVNLNLSACTRSDVNTGGGLHSDGTFDPISSFSDGKEYIASLILPNTATSIVNGSLDNPTFKGFSNLNNVSASAMTSIGNYAFRNCASLTSVSFPTVVKIDATFWGCSSLTSVNFPVATTIGSYAFSGCSSLSSVSFPLVSKIDICTFDGCTSLVSVNIPAATSIDFSAFRLCTSLTSVSFPQATTINIDAFSGCTSLTSVSFPAATSISSSAFLGCTSLISFTITGTGSLSTIENGKVLVWNNTELVAYPSASGSIILNNITRIGSYAFGSCTNLTSVNFPAATDIGDYAFDSCTNLTSVNFPAATDIGSQAFDSCTSLASMSFPQATFIGYGAFSTGTTTLTIILGSSAPTLRNGIFKEVWGSKTVTVKVPSGATGYGTIPNTYSGTDTTKNWGNGFRGGGWDWNGSEFTTINNQTSGPYINSYITLYVQYQ